MLDLPILINRFRSSVRRQDLVLIGIIGIIYLATRFYRLDGFPIFSDEGIYIRWAKTAWHDASWRFISLTDGKQPLQTWGTIPFLKLFPLNALLAGRLFAVFSGFFALTGMITLLWYTFGRKTAYIGAFLFVLNPYFLFYDRLALVDSAVNGFFLWLLLASLVLAHTRRLDVALLYGLLGGMALLAKSSAQMFFGLGVFAPIIFFDRSLRTFLPQAISYYALYAIAGFLAIAIYNIQRLSPFLHYVAEKNTTFILTLPEFIRDPWTVFSRNVLLIPQYVGWEAGLFVCVLGVIGYFLLLRRRQRLGLYLLLQVIIPFLLIAGFSKVLFPRYIIFFGSLMCIGSSYALSCAIEKMPRNEKFVLISAGMLYLFSIAFPVYTILFDYARIPLPPIDRGQYIEGWPAGWGAREIVEYVRERATAEKPVILVAEGNFGMSADVLDVFVRPGEPIIIRGYWPLNRESLEENQKDLLNNHVLVVLSHQFEYPADWPIELIQAYERPNNQSILYLFRLLPE